MALDLAKLRFNGLANKAGDWALAYARAGFEVIPFGFDRAAKKRKPLTKHGIKDATNDLAQVERLFKPVPHADIGLLVSSEFLVLDLDCKDGKNGVGDFERLTGLKIDDLNTPIASSPTGGKHVWFRTNGVQFTAQTEIDGLGIDFCVNGKNGRCVIAPYPGSGREWLKPLNGPIMNVPDFFVDWMKKKAAGEYRPPPGAAPRQNKEFTGETRRARKALDAACDALAKAPPGRRDSAIGRHVLRCGSLAGAGELDAEGAIAELLEAASQNSGIGLEHIDKVRRAFGTGLNSPAPQRTRAPKAHWLDYAIKDDRGQPLSNLANALIALRHLPEFEGVLAYDELQRCTVLTKELPISVGAKLIVGRPLPRPLADESVSQIQEFLQHSGLFRLGKDAVFQAVDQHAHDFKFHRLRDWLNEISWDGKERLATWLSYYTGAEDSPYIRAIGRMFLIGLAARALSPGCKFDYVLVLQGPQGEQKSEVFRILGGEWFSDSLQDIRNKDASQHLRGKWLIELPELSALSRGDVETWKSFITRTTERYRAPYARKETIEPRQCGFGGTTNKDEFLHDETGNRRFWPATIGSIDLDSLKHDREQLFAEAVRCYRAKEPWWPDRAFEREHILPEQNQRYEEDAWEPLITEIFTTTIIGNKTRVCDVARALGIENSRIGTADARRIARALYRLGWRLRRSGKGRFYYRPEVTDDAG